VVGEEICIGRTQGSGRKIVRNEFRELERLFNVVDIIAVVGLSELGNASILQFT